MIKNQYSTFNSHREFVETKIAIAVRVIASERDLFLDGAEPRRLVGEQELIEELVVERQWRELLFAARLRQIQPFIALECVQHFEFVEVFKVSVGKREKL